MIITELRCKRLSNLTLGKRMSPRLRSLRKLFSYPSLKMSLKMRMLSRTRVGPQNRHPKRAPAIRAQTLLVSKDHPLRPISNNSFLSNQKKWSLKKAYKVSWSHLSKKATLFCMAQCTFTWFSKPSRQSMRDSVKPSSSLLKKSISICKKLKLKTRSSKTNQRKI